MGLELLDGMVCDHRCVKSSVGRPGATHLCCCDKCNGVWAEDVDDGELEVCGSSRPAVGCGRYRIRAKKAFQLTSTRKATDSAFDAPLAEGPDAPHAAEVKAARCWESGAMGDEFDAEQHNIQTARIIDMLGTNSVGRKAIVEVIARRQGVDDADEIARIYNVASARKLRVQRGWRAAQEATGFKGVLAPLNILTTRETDGIHVGETKDTWQDMEFEVPMDSGAAIHVSSLDDCRGHKLEESPGSTRGQEFLMGDGGTIPNFGQATLNLTDDRSDCDLQSTVQIAAVTRPLMSIGKICDEGHTVMFSYIRVIVKSKEQSWRDSTTRMEVYT